MDKTKIRKLNELDLYDILKWRNNNTVNMYMYTRHQISEKEHLKWYENNSKKEHIHLLIYENDKNPMGFIKFNTRAINNTAEWGFYMNPDAPKGEGSKMGITALNYAFNDIKLQEIYGECYTLNTRSMHFHTKLGFMKEREYVRTGESNIKYKHVTIFRISKTEWNRNKSSM